jgi:deoxyribodipyrimidine photo-lyase
VVKALADLVRETGAVAVYAHRRVEPAARQLEEEVARAMSDRGVKVRSWADSNLVDPDRVKTQSGEPFQVFTAFWRRCLASSDPPRPLPAPDRVPGPAVWPRGLSCERLELLPKPDWAAGLRATWRPGETAAGERLKRFLKDGWREYATRRDQPAEEGTSRLSPHLHFGEITPRQVWHAVREWAEGQGWNASRWRESAFLRELFWREFAGYLLWHFPHAVERPLRPEWERFPWREDAAGLRAWQRGRTGYPIVDAGMRELWHTGWMHNRVRMIVASFLVKDLRISWLEGARWFWDTLVDADLASNTMGWQWSAGCGVDAAPYFRVFHPVLQGQKFDPDGAYVRRWCPELARVPSEWIHRPFEAPPLLLEAAGVRLGRDYPEPVVSHAAARQAALAAWQSLRAGRSQGTA